MPSPRKRGNTYNLSGRVALIPGGLGGLGNAVTRAFIGAGAAVVAMDNIARDTELATLQAELGTHADQLSFAVADAGDEGEVEALVRDILARHDRLDILVNVVGGFAAGQPIAELDLATWQKMFDLNLKNAFVLSKHIARPMVARGWGRIVHISSRAARSGRAHAAAYAISKRAVIDLVEIQAEELRTSGVTVNTILPSIIDTPANRAAMPKADYDRWPKAEEIARVLLFLASDDSKLISGAAIPVYGQG
jgi:NAD(P)-dependent dehydrogenase (short-subunit alcohol dehydrogenase family)